MMAEDLPDAPWATSDLPDAPWATPSAPTQEEGYIPETKRVANAALDTINTGFNPEERAKHGALENTLNVGKAALAVPALAMSPLTGAVRNYGGQGVKAITDAATSAAQTIFGGKREEMPLEAAKNQAETAMSAAMPARKVPVPAAPTPNGPLDVTLSAGQETGDLPLIQREQAALRGQTGAPAQTRAKEFADQQASEVAAAKDKVASSLDPFGQQIVESPREAGELVSGSLQGAANQAKSGVKNAYDTAKNLPGEIEAGYFKSIGSDIKGSLANAAEPIDIDALTPVAGKMLDYVDNGLAKLSIPNKAATPPNANTISGVTLRGLEQVRKNLSMLRSDAFAGLNKTDKRAAQAVMDAFDDKIDYAVNNGLFKGDPNAVKAWNDARAAHADYKRTFTGSKNDPVGRVVEKILGKDTVGPATPNDVIDYMTGATGLNPNSLNVAVTKRIQKILGEQSPEWSAVRQGLFSRLAEAGEGTADFGSAKIKNRINKFLNADGKEMADAVYSPAQRDLIQQYANLHDKLIVPQAGANWSNTGTAKVFEKIGSNVGAIIGAILGHSAGSMVGLPPFAGEAAGAALSKGSKLLANVREAKAVARQMPIVATSMRNWQKALAKANKLNSPPSGAALTYATQNLARALRPLGISLQDVLPVGTMPSSADDNQQKRDGGRANQPDKRADGGRLESRIPKIQEHEGPNFDFQTRNYPTIDRHELNASIPLGNNTDLIGRGYAFPENNRFGAPTLSPDTQWGASVGIRKTFASGGRVEPDNINHTPTDGQKKAGNYAKDHISIHGLDITVENACGEYRSGVGADGKPWRCKLPAHYGYIKNTEGADKDHVDVYVGPNIKSDKAFIIDQLDHKTGKFDEHKTFLGFASKAQVISTYKRAFSDGNAHLRLGAIIECSIADFKNWLASGKTKQPIAA